MLYYMISIVISTCTFVIRLVLQTVPFRYVYNHTIPYQVIGIKSVLKQITTSAHQHRNTKVKCFWIQRLENFTLCMTIKTEIMAFHLIMKEHDSGYVWMELQNIPTSVC
uniref:6PGL1 n=1 Tax=Arundo donax TaxID=35708 RepID=A0A0A9BHY4_ARUDO